MSSRLPSLCLWACILAMLLFPSTALAQRDVRDFNRDWRFLKGEQGEAVTQPAFDDSSWTPVRLPHDWAIAGPFDPAAEGSSGKLPWKGVGWYRKTFTLDAAPVGTRVYFDFDGVMAFPKVFVNGQLAGEWDYGYMSFRVDATPYVKFGERNVIAVEADTRQHGTRWYPGAGIYRNVRMTVSPGVHIAHWGTFVTTPNVTDARATIRVRSTIENHTAASRDLSVEVAVLDSNGRQVLTASKSGTVAANASTEIDQQFFLPKPQRWSMDAPNLYKAITKITSAGETLDTDETTFGVRTFRFDADHGFFLNGQHVQLKGVNLHHDQGPLGGAFNAAAMERQLQIMRGMGVNAIRTSHNPPDPALLDLCDRLGLFVWDEAFDKWDRTADLTGSPADLNAHGAKQIANLVQRDRNHPSTFVWSIGNEIGNSPDEKGYGKSFGRVESMRNAFLRYDTTRPVGLGCHIPNTVDYPIYEPLDLTGWNYMRRYARFREMYPEKPILYSESASALSTRGYYGFPLATSKTDYRGSEKYVSSYDLNAAAWSDIPDKEFALLEADPFVAGEFVWTGFDYLGEPTPFTETARSSYFGIVDLVGIPKDRYYLYRSHWRPEETTIHILPHWNWPDRVGKNVPVFVYTNGDSAELFLNGRSLGRRTKGEVPPKPRNLAEGKPRTAVPASAGRAFQVDLSAAEQLRFVTVSISQPAAAAGYSVQVSENNTDWTTVATAAPRTGRRGFVPPGPVETSYPIDTHGRYVRVEFAAALQDGEGLRDLRAYAEPYESDYYDVTYQYRLRWNDVVYEPGELRVVAYKNGARLGEATMRTAGPPAAIRLSPERTQVSATGDDLAYVLVEARDKDGTLCPLAANEVHFEIQGPAEIAGVGNGDELSFEPFQAKDRKLFYGKAMLILRSREGQTGTIQIKATAAGLEAGSATLQAVK